MSKETANISVTPSHSQDGLVHVKLVNWDDNDTHNKCVYDFGTRGPNNQEVGHMYDSDKWQQPQNIVLTIRFPVDQAKVLSYVEINVDQSSVEHDCKIINGGIGQNFIELLITAKNTFWFKYDARFYATNRK